MQKSDLMQYVQFGIGNESYAIAISEVSEIIRMQVITDIPNCPHYMRGVINLRGKITPVISLRSLLMLADDELSKSTRIVVVHHSEEAIGIIVDRVQKVTRFENIQPAPERVAGINGAFFTGIGLSGSELVALLKINEVLLRN